MWEEKLYVQMLGGFSVMYQGNTLVFERNSASKTAQLLQMIFYNRDKGISKEILMDAVYGRDSVENRNGSLNNTIFRLRRQLEAAGLPKGKYIVIHNGIVQWENLIPVEVDVLQFEEKVEESSQQTGKERFAALKDACRLYRGEFLPYMIGEDWIAVENTRLQNLYTKALKEVCCCLKEENKYEEIYELSTEAAKIYPFDDWQLWRIDSLIALNRCREAMDIYKETTAMFFDELGLPPSKEMLKRFHVMSDKIEQSVSVIEDIQYDLHEKEESRGAYYCTFPSFVDIYRIVSRMMERNGISVFIMLCTLTDNKGQDQLGTEKNKEASEYLRNAIRSSLRKGDFFTRYNESQFLIMLSGTQKENCEGIYERINRRFKEEYQGRMKVHYYVSSVADIPGDIGQELKWGRIE